MVLDALHGAEVDPHHLSKVQIVVKQSLEDDFEAEVLLHLLDSAFVPPLHLVAVQIAQDSALVLAW